MYWDGPGVLAFSFMTVSMVLFWVLMILGIIALTRYITRSSTAGRGAEPFDGPHRVLAERYARGEIDEEEYRRRAAVLAESGQRR
ncbi:SHOCT domain-containing protein [Saccharopolyspora rectivirgula]|jgi:putative membrane protein|uniref:SHOCT domain-containing protein n=1 Tax=Saccharopolyspora rectivirgula TaxID=28042 RepID=A0A073B163_9PSEU|nr:SHOCT domain-containing protein [Saccharopolyspora rectivirgula]KEI45733.1 hypothetical protein GU90_02215 [Saccharopolyspora rectivirgula]